MAGSSIVVEFQDGLPVPIACALTPKAATAEMKRALSRHLDKNSRGPKFKMVLDPITLPFDVVAENANRVAIVIAQWIQLRPARSGEVAQGYDFGFYGIAPLGHDEKYNDGSRKDALDTHIHAQARILDLMGVEPKDHPTISSLPRDQQPEALTELIEKTARDRDNWTCVRVSRYEIPLVVE